MYKCNEQDSCSDEDDQSQMILQKSFVVESMIEVDHLICSICHHIMWQPVTCGAQNGCQSTFCNSCINAWLRKCNSFESNDSLCPHCKRTFMCGNIPPILKSILSSIKSKCVNSPNGCDAILSYQQLGDHNKQCEYKLKRCRGCRQEILSKDYFKHIDNCQKYLIECPHCFVLISKCNYINSHIHKKQQKTVRSFNCYQNQINNFGQKINDLDTTLEDLNAQCEKLESITKYFLEGELLELYIAFYTTFNQNFSFPNPTLIKPSFNQVKQKFDFLHFYITSPIYTNSIVSMKWSIKINKMMGNILLGFCSNMNIHSLDYIVNKYGQLKRKDVHDTKYKIVRKNQFSFSQGDIIRFRYLSLPKIIKIENQTKKLEIQLSSKQIEEFVEGGKIYVFYSLDTLNDSISFI